MPNAGIKPRRYPTTRSGRQRLTRNPSTGSRQAILPRRCGRATEQRRDALDQATPYTKSGAAVTRRDDPPSIRRAARPPCGLPWKPRRGGRMDRAGVCPINVEGMEECGGDGGGEVVELIFCVPCSKQIWQFGGSGFRKVPGFGQGGFHQKPPSWLIDAPIPDDTVAPLPLDARKVPRWAVQLPGPRLILKWRTDSPRRTYLFLQGHKNFRFFGVGWAAGSFSISPVADFNPRCRPRPPSNLAGAELRPLGRRRTTGGKAYTPSTGRNSAFGKYARPSFSVWKPGGDKETAVCFSSLSVTRRRTTCAIKAGCHDAA